MPNPYNHKDIDIQAFIRKELLENEDLAPYRELLTELTRARDLPEESESLLGIILSMAQRSRDHKEAMCRILEHQGRPFSIYPYP